MIFWMSLWSIVIMILHRPFFYSSLTFPEQTFSISCAMPCICCARNDNASGMFVYDVPVALSTDMQVRITPIPFRLSAAKHNLSLSTILTEPPFRVHYRYYRFMRKGYSGMDVYGFSPMKSGVARRVKLFEFKGLGSSPNKQKSHR